MTKPTKTKTKNTAKTNTPPHRPAERFRRGRGRKFGFDRRPSGTGKFQESPAKDPESRARTEQMEQKESKGRPCRHAAAFAQHR